SSSRPRLAGSPPRAWCRSRPASVSTTMLVASIYPNRNEMGPDRARKVDRNERAAVVGQRVQLPFRAKRKRGSAARRPRLVKDRRGPCGCSFQGVGAVRDGAAGPQGGGHHDRLGQLRLGAAGGLRLLGVDLDAVG